MTANDVIWSGRTRSADDTMAVAAAVAGAVREGDVIGLIGELGAGKTQWVRGLAQGLGIAPEAVASPTFVLVHEYAPPAAPPEQRRPVLVHIDAYRLDSLGDLESIGWTAGGGVEELRRGAVVVVEWADRLGASLGEDVLEVRLTHRGESERQIELTAKGAWVGRKAELRRMLPKAESPTAG